MSVLSYKPQRGQAQRSDLSSQISTNARALFADSSASRELIQKYHCQANCKYRTQAGLQIRARRLMQHNGFGCYYYIHIARHCCVTFYC
jgi:hypothetical protein